MKLDGIVAVVTGGASGLGLACVRNLIARGGRVVIADLPGSNGAETVHEMGSAARFVAADITSATDMEKAFDAAEAFGPLRALIHCAGRGGPLRIIDKQGQPGSLDIFESIVRINLVGTFNVLRLAAARMAHHEPIDSERGVCVLTASIAAFEGQIGQAPYAASKAGILGLTLVAARDLASKAIRVCTIAPGVFDTPMLGRLTEEQRNGLGGAVPHPGRLGRPDEYAALALHIIENPFLNGETIRLDGAFRMPPR